MKQPKKATVIGGSRPTVTVSAPPSTRSELNALNNAAESQELQVAVPVNTGAIVLAPEQYPELERQLAALNFAAITSQEVILLGSQAEQGLKRTLDQFLTGLDKKSNARLFELFTELQDGVDESDLPKVLKAVMDGHVGWTGKLKKLFGKKAVDVAVDALEDVRALVSQTTVTLQTKLNKIETELQEEMASLLTRLQKFDGLKQEYREHFVEFAFAAAVARAFLEKASVHVEQERTRLGQGNPTSAEISNLRELESKLDLLKSRALALEGGYTRLPADHEVIRQIENAGLGTLQETATTGNQRFSSIKITLIALSGAVAVKELQMTNERNRVLDETLEKARGALVKQVVTTAANAPGDNRLSQSQQIERLIADTKEINAIVAAARTSNDTKFGEARKSFATSRAALAELSPGK